MSTKIHFVSWPFCCTRLLVSSPVRDAPVREAALLVAEPCHADLEDAAPVVAALASAVVGVSDVLQLAKRAQNKKKNSAKNIDQLKHKRQASSRTEVVAKNERLALR